MNISYLNKTGLSNVWNKAKSLFANKSDVETELNKKFELPSGGAENDVLTKTASGTIWKSVSSSDNSTDGYGTSIISGTLISNRYEKDEVAVTNQIDKERGISAAFAGANNATTYSTFRRLDLSFTETGVYKITLHMDYTTSSSLQDKNINTVNSGNKNNDYGYRYIIYPGYTDSYALGSIDTSTKQYDYEEYFSVTDTNQTLRLMIVPYYYSGLITTTYNIIKIADLGGASEVYFYGKYYSQDTKNILMPSVFGNTSISNNSSLKFLNEFYGGGITSSISGGKLTINVPSDYLYTMKIQFTTSSDSADNKYDWTINYKFPYCSQQKIEPGTTWRPNLNNIYTVSFEDCRVNTSGQTATITLKPLNDNVTSINLQVAITALKKYS